MKLQMMVSSKALLLASVMSTITVLTKLAYGQTLPPPLDPTRLLNQAPVVFAHNAATGYLQIPTDFSGALEGYSKNQDGTFTDLLNCGARALDLEFINDAASVVFGHGDVVIPEIGIQDGLQEILDWSSNVGSLDELILLSIDACDDCLSAITTILESLGIPLISDCSILNGLTVGGALELGPIVAVVKECFVQNFDSSLSCHGFLPSSNQANVEAVRDCVPELDGLVDLETTALVSLLSQVFSCLSLALSPDLVDVYDCWTTSDTFDFPRNQLLSYLNETARLGPPANGLLWQIQGLWQASEDSVLLGLFHPLPLPASLLQLVPSSLLQDVELSEVNRLVVDFVKEQVSRNVPLNLVEVDHVCNEYGQELLPALRSAVAENSTTPPPLTTTDSPNTTTVAGTQEATTSNSTEVVPTSTTVVTSTMSPPNATTETATTVPATTVVASTETATTVPIMTTTVAATTEAATAVTSTTIASTTTQPPPPTNNPTSLLNEPTTTTTVEPSPTPSSTSSPTMEPTSGGRVATAWTTLFLVTTTITAPLLLVG